MKQRNFIIILSLVCCFVGYLVGIIINRNSEQLVYVERMRVDTLFQILEPEPLIIDRVKLKQVFIKDTIILTKPFIATLDTIIVRDTVKVEYFFPENLMSMAIYRSNDTLKTIRITETLKENTSTNWWETTLIGIATATLGYFVGKSSK